MSNNRYSQREEMIFLQWSIYTWNEKKKKEEKYYILNEQRKWILGCQYW